MPENDRPVLRPVKFDVNISLVVFVPVTTNIFDDQKIAIEKAAKIVDNIRKEFPRKTMKHEEDGIEIAVHEITTACKIIC